MKTYFLFKKFFILTLFAFSVVIISCSKDDESIRSFPFKVMDFVTNTPIDNVKIKLGMEIGCSKGLDYKEGFTNKKGEINFDLYVNQDSIDAYYLEFPNGQSYLNNALEIEKEGYQVAQLFQDTSIFYQFRPFFQADKVINTYMYKAVPLQIEFKDADKNLAGKHLLIDVKFYPKHPLLDYNTYEGIYKIKLDTEPDEFIYYSSLAAITYDIEIIIKDAIPDVEVYHQKFSMNIDNKNPSLNVIKVDY